MNTINWAAEIVGLLAGALNVSSTFPILWRAMRQPGRDPINFHQLLSRALQLTANLLWFGYAIWQQLLSVALMTGFMSACLLLVIVQIWWRSPS